MPKKSSKNRVKKSLKRNTRKSLKRNTRKSLKINTRKSLKRNYKKTIIKKRKTLKKRISIKGAGPHEDKDKERKNYYNTLGITSKSTSKVDLPSLLKNSPIIEKMLQEAREAREEVRKRDHAAKEAMVKDIVSDIYNNAVTKSEENEKKKKYKKEREERFKKWAEGSEVKTLIPKD